jgi:hypothetical protein
VIASLWLYLLPVWILLGLLVLFGILALLARIRGGRYVRPLFMLLAKVPLFRRWLQKASQTAMERQNPELASAMKKMERQRAALTDPKRAQAAMSQLSRDERRALLEMQEEQGLVPTEGLGRAQRRALERQKRKRR